MTNASVTTDRRGFGTFGGVFTPCTLTILGVIMFLRFGQVVGQAGVLWALVIVLLSKSITTLTTLSLSAIATNTKVRGGGAYWMISRSLGVEYGGAIGLVFFLAQAISVAMYVIGFTEAFLDAFPGLGLTPRVVATAINVAVFVCVWIGAGWTIKVQYGILAILGLSLASFWAGAASVADLGVLRANLQPDYLPGQSFFTMFALFFPAATGIMAGANMSGDLRDPGRSIPRGTLASVAVTAVIYISIALLLGAAQPSAKLVASPLVMKDIAWFGSLITAGVFAATLSSALGSMMGAPRILQALAKDDIFQRLRPLARGAGPSAEPRRATVVTFVIAQAAVMLGDLDVIAPIITMFFMITYGTLNLATFYEAATHNPSYRPRFRFSHWTTSLLGAVGCIVVMALIAPLWAVISIIAMLALHRYIERREVEARWGDVQSGIAFERARRNLLLLEEETYHPKNWRPVILALSGEARTRPQLAIYGHWLSAGHGVLVLGHVISGELDGLLERRAAQEKLLRDFIREHQIGAFATAVVAESRAGGIQALVQCAGLGGFRINAVVLGWTTEPERLEPFGRILRLIGGLGRSVIVLRTRGDRADPWLAPRVGTIDVWWRGKRNGPLMLLLGHLLVQNPEWRGREVRLLQMVSSEGGRTEAAAHLGVLIESARIEATPVVVVGSGIENLARESAAAALVVFGFDPPGEGEERERIESMDAIAGELSDVLFVSSAGGVELEV